MEAFVQMSLETYDVLKYNNEYLKRKLKVEVYSLEQYLNIDSWDYGMNYKDELLNLGFTKQDMDEFIANKYNEYLRNQVGILGNLLPSSSQGERK